MATRITNIFAFQGLGRFAVVVPMAFPGGPVGDMVLHHLKGKVGGRERKLPHKTRTSQTNTEVPTG